MGIIRMISPDNVVISIGDLRKNSLPNTIKTVSPNGCGNHNGSSWNDCLSLTEFISDLNIGTTLNYWLSAGNYNFTSEINQSRNNISIYGGFDTTEISLADRNFYINKTIFNGLNTYSILNLSNVNNILFDGVNFKNGYSDSNGGAVKTNNCIITFNNSIIENNIANTSGGFIYVTGGTLNIYNSIIQNNTSGNGGAIYLNANAILNYNNIEFINNTPNDYYPDVIPSSVKTVSLNGAGSGTGLGDGSNNWSNAMSWSSFITDLTTGTFKGEYWIEAGTYTLTNKISINRNSISIVGGFNGEKNKKSKVSTNKTLINGNNSYNVFYIYNSTKNLTDILLEDLTIYGGKSVNGAGIYINNSNIIINKCIIKNNNSTGDGAGVYVSNNSYVDIKNSTIKNNISGGLGGGIYHNLSTSNIINCSIFNNISATGAGGIHYYSTKDERNCLINNTIINNKSNNSNGGGLYNSGMILETNNIIYNNTGTNNTVNNIYDYNFTGKISNSCIEGGYPLGVKIITENPSLTANDATDTLYYTTGNLNMKIGQFVNTLIYNNIRIPINDQIYTIRPTTSSTTIGAIEYI